MSSVTIVVPCAGKSSRFPNLPPKWMLADNHGAAMLFRSLEGLRIEDTRLVITILQEHADRFSASEGIRRLFGQTVEVIELTSPTRSQAETVARTIEHARIDGPLFVKDSDNTFRVEEKLLSPYGYVCVESLNNLEIVNPRNKSYVRCDHSGRIELIEEKRVISDTFSVGGYFFPEANSVVEAFESLTTAQKPWDRELYMSDIVGWQILSGHHFVVRKVSRYQDWGTIADWQRSLTRQRSLLVAVEGFVFDWPAHALVPPNWRSIPRPGIPEFLASAISAGHSVTYLTVRGIEEVPAIRNEIRQAECPDGEVVSCTAGGNFALLTGAHPSAPNCSNMLFELGSKGVEEIRRQLNLS